jgi:hypothetical protein
MSETPKRPDPASPPATPLWVKIVVIMFIALVLVVIILHLMGFGFGNHSASSFTSYAWLMERPADHL